METVKLGSQGLSVSVEGLGAMGMSAFYSGRDDVESAATLHRAVDLGVTFIDTAEMYGPFLNERLIAKVLGGRRGEITLATKTAGNVEEDGTRGEVNGSPARMRTALERSLRNLRTDVVDLYYVHRIDPNVPIEETVGELAKFVQEGKVRYLGLSEAAPETIRRAHATHPISALQTEYSLYERSPETNGVLDTVRELGIGFVAYSPLGRGFLSGVLKSVDELDADDFRRNQPRFNAENIGHNLAIVDKIAEIAVAKGITPSQLALAWLFAQGVTAIPGTKRRKYLEENAAAVDVKLTAEELAALDAAAPRGVAAGARYAEDGLRSVHL
jgi:aryl-alcohol dehydrogenase-like predicted oxidoreductase